MRRRGLHACEMLMHFTVRAHLHRRCIKESRVAALQAGSGRTMCWHMDQAASPTSAAVQQRCGTDTSPSRFLCFLALCHVLNLLTCLRAGADIPQPPVSETAGREDEVDLISSLHPVALGSTAGCVEDAKADSILVRSQGYSTHKQKEASQASMYELRRAFTMPAPSSSSRHSHVARLGLEMLDSKGQSHRIFLPSASSTCRSQTMPRTSCKDGFCMDTLPCLDIPSPACLKVCPRSRC